ncbi:MAG TPA: 2-oxoacid:ferredoxin oxidoreductase subunit gamma [Anaerolineae bacterium]|nr:2-oxoacid:ferredoxin oxidoreductase subunit gamma [Anaerolineae bacterium]
MQIETVIAGFGGQGVLFTGKVLAYAAMNEGLEVTWFPSYGPEMRGGTANCVVVFSDEEIGSPQVLNPKAAIVMNQPSLEKYEQLVQKDGFLVINSSMVNREVKRDDIKIINIPGTDLAEALSDKRFTNIILLGGLVANSDFFPLKKIEKALGKSLKGKKGEMLELNIKALYKGASYKVQ